MLAGSPSALLTMGLGPWGSPGLLITTGLTVGEEGEVVGELLGTVYLAASLTGTASIAPTLDGAALLQPSLRGNVQ